jgi:prepilin-type N-terminal cleavage/methylation domain-containing protein
MKTAKGMTLPLGNDDRLAASAASLRLAAGGWRLAEDAGDRRSGFTLTELMAVLAIISIVGGLSAGAFHLAHRSYALSASGSRVEGLLRAARNSAISSGVPSRVVIDTAAGEAIAFGFETVGEWGFESEEDGVSYGARRAPAALRDGAEIGEGRAGHGLSLSGKAYADCGTLSSYDLRAGVAAEAWIRWSGEGAGGHTVVAGSGGTRRLRTPGAAGSGRTASRAAPLGDAAGIVARGGAYFLGLAPDGSLEGRIGDYRVRTSSGAVLPGRWTRVALIYDGQEVALSADGVERETYLPDRPPDEKKRPPPPPSIPPSAESLTIGSPQASFRGEVDEVRLHGMVEPLRYPLGPGERLLGWKKVIRFERRGRLDPRYHETGLRVILCSSEEPVEPVVRTEAAVDYSLTYREWVERRGLEFREGGEAAAEANLLLKYSGARQIIIEVDLSGALR